MTHYLLLDPSLDTLNSAIAKNPGSTIVITGGGNQTKVANDTNSTDAQANSEELIIDSNSYTYVYDDGSSSGSKSGTTIIIVVAVLIVMIPLGFIVQCVVKRCRNKDGKDGKNAP